MYNLIFVEELDLAQYLNPNNKKIVKNLYNAYTTGDIQKKSPLKVLQMP